MRTNQPFLINPNKNTGAPAVEPVESKKAVSWSSTDYQKVR